MSSIQGVLTIYCCFSILAVFLFGVLSRRSRVPIIWTVGWLTLPVTFYPQVPTDYSQFPYWIVGLSLPSDLWPNKLWVINVTTLLCLVIYEPERLIHFRPCLWDAVAGVWCFFPVIQWACGVDESHSVGLNTIVMLGVWGAPWTIGRVAIQSRDEAISFLRWMVLLTVSVSPFAILEWMIGPVLYRYVWSEPHPFRFDGADRYIGYRPILFFEHGNQYGLWICMIALISFWFVKSKQRLLVLDSTWGAYNGDRYLTCFMLVLACLAQSVGAIFNMFLALGYLYVAPRIPKRCLIAGIGVLVFLSALYLFDLIPIRRLAMDTALGRSTVELFRKVGRHSFSWRIGQDLKAIPLIREKPILGNGKWDWWRESNSRPWGYFVLLLGQYGVVGTVLNLTILLGTSVLTLLRSRRMRIWDIQQIGVLVAVVVIFGSFDGLMNAFLFTPATMLGAALLAFEGQDAPSLV